jgi:hypothetical protein
MANSFEEQYKKAILAASGDRKLTHGLDPEASYKGTCQACFRSFVVKKATRRPSGFHHDDNRGMLVVVLHGYERPGSGYLEGECMGQNEEPFQVSKEITERFLVAEEGHLDRIRKRLADLKASKVKKLLITIKSYSSSWSKEKDQVIEIEEGWVNPKSFYDDFQSRLKSLIWKTQQEEKSVIGNIEFLRKMLASWKYDPASLAGHVAKIEAEKQAKVDAKKAILDAKEAHEESIVAAFLAEPKFIEIAKIKPLESHRPQDGPALQDIQRRLERARQMMSFGDRSYSRKRVISDMRRFVFDYKIKVKLPRAKKE